MSTPETITAAAEGWDIPIVGMHTPLRQPWDSSWHLRIIASGTGVTLVTDVVRCVLALVCEVPSSARWVLADLEPRVVELDVADPSEILDALRGSGAYVVTISTSVKSSTTLTGVFAPEGVSQGLLALR